MSRARQRGSNIDSRPLWLRIAVFFCVLLIGGAGIAQAAHVHGDWLPHNTPQITALLAQNDLPGEDSCPLCMAMHSAVPVAMATAMIAAVVLQISLVLLVGRKPESPWHFAAFCRPPPLF